jgi:subtilisin family serine protease
MMPNDKNNPNYEVSNEKAAPSASAASESVRPPAAKSATTVKEIIDRGRVVSDRKIKLNKMVDFGEAPSKTEAATPPPSHRGELIISHARADLAATDVVDRIRGEKIEHVGYLDDMDKKIGFEPHPKAPEFQLHLIRVPEGEETWKANYLQFVYKQALQERLRSGRVPPDFAAALGRPDLHFNVQPNHEIWLAATALAMAARGPISARQFRFTQYHEQYKSMLRIPARVDNPAPVTIAVLDTGVAGDFALPNSPQPIQTNLVDEDTGNGAIDHHGHGTVMCSIIRDVAPFATLHVFKAFGDDGRTTEWHILYALQTLGDANIVNMSITFGMLDEVACSECGHRSQMDRPVIYSHRVRSNAFHNQIRQMVEREERVLVASAGNRGAAELEYPSRFEEVIAISSVNSLCRRSSFSNYNGTGRPHPNHCALPGGETQTPQELVGSFGADVSIAAGTSHAAAYASGLLAHLWNRARQEERNPRGMAAAMANAAHKQLGMFAAYNIAEHGNGIPGL